MIIKYKFADGSVKKVEVSDEIGCFIKESRRLEANLSRKERYHCDSIEGSLFEGRELGTSETPEKALIKRSAVIEIHENRSNIIHKRYRTCRSRRNRIGIIIAHRIKTNARSGRVLFLVVLNTSSVHHSYNPPFCKRHQWGYEKVLSLKIKK